jgi:hypothetical protein
MYEIHARTRPSAIPLARAYACTYFARTPAEASGPLGALRPAVTVLSCAAWKKLDSASGSVRLLARVSAVRLDQMLIIRAPAVRDRPSDQRGPDMGGINVYNGAFSRGNRDTLDLLHVLWLEVGIVKRQVLAACGEYVGWRAK